jgi:hypothetical protein
MVLLAVGAGIGGALVKKKTYYFNFEHTTDIKDNLLNVPQLGITETVRGMNTFNYFSSKIDQIWNTNFNSSLRANVGELMLKDRVADLMAVPLLNQQETHNKGTVSLALKQL